MTSPATLGRPAQSGGGADGVIVAILAAATGAAGWFWLASWIAGWVAVGRGPHLRFSQLGGALRSLPHHVGDPLQTWPPTGQWPRSVASTLVFYAVAALGLVAVAGAVRLYGRHAAGVARTGGAGRSGDGRRHATPVSLSPSRSGRAGPSSAGWARPADLRLLRLRRGASRQQPRLVLGRTAGPGRMSGLVATESRHSVLVIGPTQSGKTTGLAIPAILEWPGPVVATSVKDDLAAVTAGWRASRSPCWLFDPTCSTALPPSDQRFPAPSRSRWSPISGCAAWSDAQKMAAWLVESTPGRRGMADAAFWYTTAAKQLAPLLLAAQRAGMSMVDVVRWTDAQEYDEPTRLLQISGDDDAAVALAACAARDERIRSSVTTTLETVLQPFADPTVAAATSTTDLSLDDLFDRAGTLFLCGPTHEQQRVQGLFASLVSTVIAEAVRRTGQNGGPLDPPLLLVLDEAANIAPIRDLDTIASTGAGLGIQLVTVCQDLAQLASRYDPERARTIANNHRAKLLLSGVGDLQTLDLISGLAGEEAVREQTTTHDLRHGGRTRTESTVLRRLAPTDQLRRVPPGEAVLVYGHLPPVRLRLRPWYKDPALKKRAGC